MARIRTLLPIGLTALAFIILVTAQLPDTPAELAVPALRTAPAPAPAGPSAATGWVIRIGLAALLLTGLVARLREET